MEHQALETRFGAMGFQNAGNDQMEEAFIVVAIHARLHFGQPFLVADGRAAVVENSGVQILLGGEVAENNRFSDTGRERDLPCGRAAESPFREEVDGDLDQLAAPVLAGHAKVSDRFGRGLSLGRARHDPL